MGVAVGAIVGVGVGVGVASGVGLGVGADVAVGVAAAVGSGVGVLVGTGIGVGVGSGVAVAVAAGVEVGVAVGGGVAEGVATAAGVGVGVATGTGVSAGATVAVGCGSVVGSGVAAGAAAAVGVAGAVVATAGEVCSPPQAVRAMTADRHSSNSTAAAIPVPVILPLIDFMAPFSAPGKVGSMPWTVYPPGVGFDSTGACGCAVPRGSADGKKTPARGRGPEPQPSGRGVITLRKERGCLRSSTVGGRGPSRPPGYVRRSEHRLSEPRFQP